MGSSEARSYEKLYEAIRKLIKLLERRVKLLERCYSVDRLFIVYASSIHRLFIVMSTSDE
jgi:hypothetical protein